MKRMILSVILAGVVGWAGFGQVRPPGGGVERVGPGAGAEQAIELPTFDLDFQQGKPQDLVEMIQHEIGTLNVIIPTEYATTMLPAMKLKSVNVKQVFEALEAASRKVVAHETGRTGDGRRMMNTTTKTIGFQTIPPVRRESVWYFYVNEAPAIPESKVVRYFQLKPYLEEYKIDDITTAVQAGWKMLPDRERPELNFHEDTKLLIAVGAPHQLEMIRSVLNELQPTLPAKVQLPGAAAPEKAATDSK